MVTASWLWLVCLGVIYQAHAGACFSSNLENKFDVVYQWKYFDFDFGSDELRQAAIKSGEFDYTKAAPIDVDRWHDKTFVTIIRDKGVPSSLNVLTDKIGDSGPILKPYPDWSWAKFGNCSAITSVFRVAIDRCDRLWVLDTGYLGTEKRECPAQLLAFDLHTSELLKRVTIPIDISMNKTLNLGLLVTPVVQTFGPRCEKTFVYMADVEGYALVVYDGDSLRRLTSSALVYDPKATKYTIEGESFTLQDGPVGMALSPLSQNLYFSPMSSFNLVSVNTRALTQLQGDDVQYQVHHDVLWTQASSKAMARNGALLFGLVHDTGIGCWSEFKPLERKNLDVVAKNHQTLQFTSGMKVKECSEGEEVWILTNRFQKISAGSLKFDEVNFRILKANVKDLVAGTRCQPPPWY